MARRLHWVNLFVPFRKMTGVIGEKSELEHLIE